MKPRPYIIVAALAGFLAACSERDAPGVTTAAQRGRKVYLTFCIACHSADPGKDGSTGPALAGSSRELLAAKVLRGEYPPGYTPKRTTSTMPMWTHLAEHVDDLAAFLATPVADVGLEHDRSS